MACLFVNNLTVMDFSYLDAQRGVVGESWIVDIELHGDLDEQGMVFDFGHVKKQIKQFIDAQADHRLLVPVASDGCREWVLIDERLRIEFPLADGSCVVHESPRDAVMLVAAALITPEGIARDLEAQLHMLLPDNVERVILRLRAESIDGDYYHYTHGLQKHLGQCQRIAHGHRSRLEIRLDGQRDAAEEAHWCGLLKDSYIATAAHVSRISEVKGIAHAEVQYRAQQGDFLLQVPERAVFVMDAESTVENIAAELAHRVALRYPGKVVQVRAFEGVEKGALAEVG